MFPFCGYQLDGKLFGFLLLHGKVYADVVNGLQHRVAKMQIKSEMYAKYGHAIYFLVVINICIFYVKDGFKKKPANYPHFVDKRLTPPPLIHIGRS